MPILSYCRAVAELPYFRTFKVNENQICFAGMEAITVLLHGAGKELGGQCAFLSFLPDNLLKIEEFVAFLIGALLRH